ncbi:coiled-coil domain-containing protein [Nocardiopsis suaedae]|uniref:ARB-07466-like C-terminal domain-containing protein n=1 Tax=Nocardiopsis suaedae TaxID=3018444 RepID=A0ABT4TIK4_9ACTN|nr:hypothetical protein [Nocardiopsis suaedae]MDA2804421.1 hypothetical protein [Nocardiopsis suaedae]
MRIHRRSTRVRAGATIIGAAASAALLLTAPSAYADDDEPSLDELNAEAEGLEEELDGELVVYDEAKAEAEKAQKLLEKVEEQYETARGNVTELAAAQYKGSGIDPAMEVVLSGDPEQTLGKAAMAGQVSHNNGERLLALTDSKAELEEASEQADAEFDEAKEIVDELKDKKDEIKERIERYEAEQVPEPPEEGGSGGGGGTGGGPVPERLKGWGFDGATPRMAAIRDEIIANFSLPYEVGCVRNSADDHGTGQACDFMMSAGGSMPSGQNQQIGQNVADYAKSNADRLGVKYIIWEQRIWDSRNPGAGWKQMEDRGSPTQNHYDHVHISSF